MRRKTSYCLTALFYLLVFNSCQKGLKIPVYGPFDILLLMGQSNTLAGKGIDHSIDVVDPRVMQLGRFGSHDHQILIAGDPLENHTPLDSSIGFALTFAKLYANQKLENGRHVLIIPCGASGSGFLHNGGWNRSENFYKDAVERTNYVLNKYPGSIVKCFLWHQGEADVTFGAAYQNAFEDMKKTLVIDIKEKGVDSVPFILGGMVPYWVTKNPGFKVVDSVLSNEQNHLPFTGFADPLKPFVIEKPNNDIDPIHFDAKGQREMGKRYFIEYERLAKK